MPFLVPVASLNAQSSQTVTLEGRVYKLTFTLNTRDQSWSLTVAEQDGTPIVSGIKLLPQLDLLSRHKDPRLPPGILTTVDVVDGDKAARPTKSQLGTKLVLVYWTEADIDAIVSA